MADTGASADPLKYKVVIVGASGSGKTSILERFQHGRFNPNPAVTTGVFFATKRVEINGRIMDAQLWDTAGQERFRAISTQFYRNADAAMIVYDITARESFDGVEQWVQDIHRHAGRDCSILLVGNKLDRRKDRAVRVEEGLSVADAYNLGYIETSARSGRGVELAFYQLLQEVYHSKEVAPKTRGDEGADEGAAEDAEHRSFGRSMRESSVSLAQRGAGANEATREAGGGGGRARCCGSR